jgi:hypothetical protein
MAAAFRVNVWMVKSASMIESVNFCKSGSAQGVASR